MVGHVHLVLDGRLPAVWGHSGLLVPEGGAPAPEGRRPRGPVDFSGEEAEETAGNSLLESFAEILRQKRVQDWVDAAATKIFKDYI